MTPNEPCNYYTYSTVINKNSYCFLLIKHNYENLENDNLINFVINTMIIKLCCNRKIV